MTQIKSKVNDISCRDGGDMLQLLKTPEPPYYAVISTHIHGGNNVDSYDEEMKNLISIVESLPGFLGAESAYETNPDGTRFKIGVTYWRDIEDIHNWRTNASHHKVKNQARSTWYKAHNVRICHVIKQYGDNLSVGTIDKLAYK